MAALIVFIVFGSFASVVLGWRWMRHREKLAELEVRRLQALAAAPPDPAREHLAKELLAAYDEAGGDLMHR